MLRPSGPTGQTLAEWLRPSGRADERPQCRIHTGRATRRASAHVPSKGRHQSQTLCNLPKRGAKGAGTLRRATNPRTGGRPPQETAGTNPTTGQAAGIFLTLSAPAYSSWTSAVTCPRSRMAVVRCFGAWYLFLGFRWNCLSRSYRSRLSLCSALVSQPPLPEVCLRMDRQPHASVLSLSQEWSRRIAVRLRRPCRRVLCVPQADYRVRDE